MAPSVTASLSGGKLTATATSTTQGATFTYQWYRDGAPIPGATAATFTPTQKGSYYVEVQAAVTIPPAPCFLPSPECVWPSIHACTHANGSAAVGLSDPARSATPPKTGDSTPLALYALLALLSLAALTALAARRRRHG